MAHSVTQFRFIREIAGRQVWVGVGDDVDQVILLEEGGWSGLLAMVLARPEERWTEELDVSPDGETRSFVALPHTDEVDDFLWQLIDALIDIRYQHPTMTQLPLALTKLEAAELKRVLGAPVA